MKLSIGISLLATAAAQVTLTSVLTPVVYITVTPVATTKTLPTPVFYTYTQPTVTHYISKSIPPAHTWTTSTVQTVFFRDGLNSQEHLYASVVAADAVATTYSFGCGTLRGSTDYYYDYLCGSELYYLNMTVQPQSHIYAYTMQAYQAAESVSCTAASSSLNCWQSYSGGYYNQAQVTSEVVEGTNIDRYFIPITITGGLEKLSGSAASTAGSGNSTRPSGSGNSTIPSGNGGNLNAIAIWVALPMAAIASIMIIL